MLNLLYPISYLLCLTGLILWFYFKDNRSASRQMSSLFLVSFFIYLIALAFSEASLSYKLLILFRDLVILGAVSQVFNYVRRSALVVLMVAIVFYGLIQFFGFSMLYSTFPEIRLSVAPVNDEFEILVETPDGSIPDSYSALIAKYGLKVQPAFTPADPSLSHLDEFLLIGVPDESEKKMKRIIRQLLRLKGTKYVEYNEEMTVEIREDPAPTAMFNVKHVNDPLASRQWGWDAIQGDRLHELFAGTSIRPKKKALIAILDSGVDAQHEDLAAQFTSAGPVNDNDPLGHGTHCAGIAAAVSNNSKGIASLIPNGEYIQITSIKVMNAMGVGNQQTTIDGIIKAADMGADVISMSLGSVSSDRRQRAYEEAVKYANAKGAIVIAAAGNSNQNAKGYSPANAKGIITVAALGTDQRKAPFSNSVEDMGYGVAAPGMKILSTYPNQQYKELDGTSMATPMVAGLVGLLKSIQPELTTKRAYNILHDSGQSVLDEKTTGRLIQAADAIERVMD